VAEEPERSELFDELVALMPRFGGYQEQTDRTIPVGGYRAGLTGAAAGEPAGGAPAPIQ